MVFTCTQIGDKRPTIGMKSNVAYQSVNPTERVMHHTHAHTHTQTYTYTHTHIYTQIRTPTHTQIRTHTHIRTHTIRTTRVRCTLIVCIISLALSVFSTCRVRYPLTHAPNMCSTVAARPAPRVAPCLVPCLAPVLVRGGLSPRCATLGPTATAPATTLLPTPRPGGVAPCPRMSCAGGVSIHAHCRALRRISDKPSWAAACSACAPSRSGALVGGGCGASLCWSGRAGAGCAVSALLRMYVPCGPAPCAGPLLRVGLVSCRHRTHGNARSEIE